MEQNMHKKPTTPENVPRLFDLIQPKDPKYGAAFYFAVRDTLVAKDLEQAVRIAYRGSKCVWRVVTLKGELVDKSGTMTGGGRATRKGMMNVLSAGGSARMAAAAAASSGPVEAVVDTKALSIDVEKLADELKAVRQERNQLEQQVRKLKKRVDKLQSEIPKFEMELGDLARKRKSTEDRLHALEAEGKTSLSAQEQQELEALQEQLAASQAELDAATQQSEEQQAQGMYI
jgi:structural maintenance of chromosome 4